MKTLLGAARQGPRVMPGRLIALTSLALCAPLLAPQARAACFDLRNGAKPLAAHHVPFAAHAAGEDGNHSIVGLWHVTYTSGGDLFYEALDTWNADGTEIESANASPINGNVCMGAWKQVGEREVKLSHIGWQFDDGGNAAGSFTINEDNKVSVKGDAYTGSFDFKVYDTDGNLQFELKGDVSATRISP